MTDEQTWQEYILTLQYVAENDILFNRIQSKKAFHRLLSQLGETTCPAT